MLQVQKLARLGQEVPLLAAFPFAVTVDGTEPRGLPPVLARTYNGRRDYSTCVEEESINPFFGRSKNDVKKDD